MSMPVIHSRKTIETALLRRWVAPLTTMVGSFAGFVRAVCDMDPVGFAFALPTLPLPVL
jgi:hypothetical protein